MTFLKTNIMTLASKILCLASSMFISIYIARFLGPDAKGTYYILVQLVAILATVALLGLDYSVIYYLGKGLYARRTVLTSNLITFLVSIGVAVLLLLLSQIRFSGNALLKYDFSYLAIIAIVIPFMNSSRLNSAVLMGFNRYVSFNIMNVALYLTMIVSFFIFVVIFKMGLTGALISFLLSYMIMSVIYWVITLNFGGMSKKLSETTEKVKTKTLLKYGSKVFLVPILLLLLYRIDSFFLSYHMAISSVGFYSVALSIVELLLFIPESTGTILFPKLMYVKPEDIGKSFLFIFKISVVITLSAELVLCAGIKYILPFIYGNVYMESVKLAYVLLPGIFAMSTYYLFASYFQALGKPGIVTFVLIVAFIVKLVLCILLIPKFGSIGAAISSTGAYAVCFIMFLLIFRERSRFKMKEIFTLQKEDLNIIRNSLNNIFDFEK